MKKTDISLASHIAAFVSEKRLQGYRYHCEDALLRSLVRFLEKQNHHEVSLPAQLVEKFIYPGYPRSYKTLANIVVILGQLINYLRKKSVPASLPQTIIAHRKRCSYVPYIFSAKELRGILDEVDQLHVCNWMPHRHRVLPEVFRLLMFTGMRAGEVANLQVSDVDLEGGVLLIREGKFHKDRLVPLTTTMTHRLRVFAASMGERSPETPFFGHGGGYRLSIGGIYSTFRRCLNKVGIPHRGRGYGPRVHDLRHTFAVRRMESWHRLGVDFAVWLPMLCTYLGHLGLQGTQRYLRLTYAAYPEIEKRMNALFEKNASGGLQ